MPNAGARVAQYYPALIDAMREFEISASLKRQAAFLAQLAHESGEMRYTREIADGSAYEGRVDLGNTEPGDGERFRGRGLLQITGRDAYRRCGEYFREDFLSNPEKLEETAWACRSAGWVWTVFKKLNPLADLERFGTITRKINGGYNHIDERIFYWLRARRVLGITQ